MLLNLICYQFAQLGMDLKRDPMFGVLIQQVLQIRIRNSSQR